MGRLPISGLTPLRRSRLGDAADCGADRVVRRSRINATHTLVSDQEDGNGTCSSPQSTVQWAQDAVDR